MKARAKTGPELNLGPDEAETEREPQSGFFLIIKTTMVAMVTFNFQSKQPLLLGCTVNNWYHWLEFKIFTCPACGEAFYQSVDVFLLVQSKSFNLQSITSLFAHLFQLHDSTMVDWFCPKSESTQTKKQLLTHKKEQIKQTKKTNKKSTTVRTIIKNMKQRNRRSFFFVFRVKSCATGGEAETTAVLY